MLVRSSASSEWMLPQHYMTKARAGGPQARLQQLFGAMGCAVSLSFLYAVFEREEGSQVYIIYRGTLDAPPKLDRLGDLEIRLFRQPDVPWADIDAFLFRGLLQRYFAERSNARFGIYSRMGAQGRVELLAADQTQHTA